MRDIEESRAIETIRTFFESDGGNQRLVSAEWLAGRLGLRLDLCRAALGRLVSLRVLQRQRRRDGQQLFSLRQRSPAGMAGHILIAVIALAITGIAIFVALNARYVFVAGEALAIGLMVAFAWLDAELHDGKKR